jgi:histidinol-phosphate aminotransferase
MRAVLEIDKVNLNRYPDPYASSCVNAFASLFDVDPRRVTAGNGSDELIGLICAGLLEKGGKVLVLPPDFTMYSFYAKLYELEVLELPKNSEFVINVDETVAYINKNAVNCLMFSNPCNPTSIGIGKPDVMRIVRECSDTLIVVDEAYMDFWDQSVTGSVCDYDNLIVLKTCSKAFGLASVRLGFALAGDTLSRVLKAVKSPYNINALTQAAAAVMLSRPDWLRESAAVLVRQRDALAAECKKLSGNRFSVYNTKTNFILIQSPEASGWHQKLAERGVAVRFIMGDCLRVTAGSDEDHAIFLQEFQEILEEF